jgi:spore maturation protein CgeB
MKKIDILVGDNPYGTTVHFSKSLAQSLNKQGIQTRLFWVGDGHFFEAFYSIVEDPPELTCSFSDISLEGKPLGDMWGIPHLSLLVDPPIYFLHQMTTKCGWLSCVDEEDCAFVRSLNFPHVFFLPHAADAQERTPVSNERLLDTVFFGTCIDYEAIASSWPKHEKELLLAASDRVLSKEGPSVARSLIELSVGPCDLPRLHAEVDRYSRGKERIQLIRSLEKVAVWGDGPWQKYIGTAHDVHPAVSFEQALELMKKSKIVLNSSPRFKKGAHERIFYALMCGASVYTAENSYIKAHLPELFTCHLGEWEAPDFKHWKEHAEQGQSNVLHNHTWDARAITLVNYLKLQTLKFF